MEGIITIDSNLIEQLLIESCLNMKHSGIDWKLPFLFYALGKQWHIDKFNYYYNLLEENSSNI